MNILEVAKSGNRLWKSMTLRYAIGLSAVAVLATIAHIVVRLMLASQAADNRVIEIAFNQLLTSERLGVTVAKIQFSSRSDERESLLGQAREQMAQIERRQAELSKLLASDPKSLQEIEFPLDAIRSGFRRIDSTPEKRSSRINFKRQAALEVILTHELAFRDASQSLAIRYQERTGNRFERLQRAEFWVLISILIVLFLEAVFVFRPSAAKIQAAVVELERSKQLRSDFIARMSHEIRNPMNAVMGMADLLSEHVTAEEPKKYVQVIRRAGRSLLSFVNDLLDFSKLETGTLRVQSAKLNPTRLCEETIELVLAQAQDKGLMLKCEADSGVPHTVMADRKRLQQVLLNLIQNALKFTKDGGITVRVKAEADRLVFSVRDTGIGIPSDVKDRIFESFVQLDQDARGTGGGAGLGLSIAKQLVELMHGKIWVESTIGKGSTFSFSVPLEVSQTDGAEEPHQEIAPKPLIDITAFHGKMLVVDDAQDNHVVIDAYLKNSSLQIEHVYSGAEALKKTRETRYELILMDVQMPETDGYTVTRAIRAEEKARALEPCPILMLTAHDDPKELSKALAAGCTDFFIKPITRDTLFEIVSRFCTTKPKSVTPSNKADKMSEIDHLLGDLVAAYLNNRQKDLAEMESAMLRKDFTFLAQTSHRIRGSAATYGFAKLGDQVKVLETAAKESDEATCKQTLVEIRDFLDSVKV